jgi:hypothetical protein
MKNTLHIELIDSTIFHMDRNFENCIHTGISLGETRVIPDCFDATTAFVTTAFVDRYQSHGIHFARYFRTPLAQKNPNVLGELFYQMPRLLTDICSDVKWVYPDTVG